MRLKGLCASEKLVLKICSQHQISANSVDSLLPTCIWTFFLLLNDIPSIM